METSDLIEECSDGSSPKEAHCGGRRVLAKIERNRRCDRLYPSSFAITEMEMLFFSLEALTKKSFSAKNEPSDPLGDELEYFHGQESTEKRSNKNHRF